MVEVSVTHLHPLSLKHMKSDRAGIFIDLKTLKRKLRLAQFCMTKADRIIYGTPALAACKAVLSHFGMAYDFPDEKDYYIRQFVAEFTILRIDIEELFEENVIKATNPEAIGGRVINPDALKNEMVDLLGRIDEGVSKYARANDISRNLATWREKMLEMLTIIAKGKGAKN